MELLDKEQKDEAFTGISELISQYTSFYRMNYPITAAASFEGGTYSAAQLGIATGNQMPRKTPDCFCGQTHDWNNCPYVNPAKRPTNWRGDQNHLKAMNTLLESETAKGWILAGTIKKYKKQTPDAPIPTASAHNKDQVPRDLDDDDFQPATSSGYALKVFNTSTIAPTALSNRWVMDPGSDTHVANSKAFGWKTTSVGGPNDHIIAGGEIRPIVEWGTAVLAVNTPRGRESIRLRQVAYIPGFHANVMGLSRCRKRGIHFDSGQNLLYEGRRNRSQTVATLEFTGGHWLIDSDPAARPEPQLLTTNYSDRPPEKRFDPTRTL
jgi:hypothetical protein